jgi:hypothetical protein
MVGTLDCSVVLDTPFIAFRALDYSVVLDTPFIAFRALDCSVILDTPFIAFRALGQQNNVWWLSVLTVASGRNETTTPS